MAAKTLYDLATEHVARVGLDDMKIALPYIFWSNGKLVHNDKGNVIATRADSKIAFLTKNWTRVVMTVTGVGRFDLYTRPDGNDAEWTLTPRSEYEAWAKNIIDQNQKETQDGQN